LSSSCTRVSPPKNQPRSNNLPRRLWLAAALVGLTLGCRRAPRPAASDSGSAPDVVTGFAGPSAVLHDPDYDRYYIANTNGSPDAADDHGFISKVSAAGRITALKWIDGSSPDVSLSAPRGMAVGGPYLFVTDRTTIRRFDRRTGAPEGEVPVPGAVALDAMIGAADGTLYFTDSGDSARAGAVYRLAPGGKLDRLAQGPELGHPTGIAVSGDSVWVVSRLGEMYRVADGKPVDLVKLPNAGLEGLVVFEGDAFVSTTEGRAVLRGKIGGPFAPLVSDIDAPAGIGHDLWRNRILVPLFGKNELRIVRLAF
jgi:streptogramin lyase